MQIEIKKNQTFFARSHEEAKAIELSRAETGIKSIALRSIVMSIVACCNLLIRLLESLLFKCNRYTDNDPENICIYTVGTLGDNVLLLPAIAAISRNYPEAKVTVITNCDGFSEDAAREIVGKSSHVNRHTTLPGHPVQRRGLRIVVDFPEINGFECDLFVNLSPFGNRGWIGAVIREMIFAKRLGAKRAIGFRISSYNRKGFFNRVQHYFVENEARRPREILKELGLTPVENEDLLPRDAAARERVGKILSEHSSGQCPVFLLNPGAKLKASHWSAERFGKVAVRLAETYNACVVVNGTMGEKELCDRVLRASEGKAVNLAGELNIQELVELLRMSAACITNNTGTMTLSAMVGTPEVVISSTRFSPTFYMPITDRMIWLFSFNDNSYSYNDDVEISEDLLNISEDDVIKAVEELVPLTRTHCN